MSEERIDYAAKVTTLHEKRAKALMIAQEGQRRAYGLGKKQQQEAQVVDEAQAQRRNELISSLLFSLETITRQANTADAREYAAQTC